MKKFRRCTITDVARKAGVSRSTAGHILGNTSPIVDRFSEETKERVRRCARELGYTRNVFAAGLRSGNTRLLAIVIEGPWVPGSDHESVENDIKAAQWSLASAMIIRARERGRLPLVDIIGTHTGPDDTETVRHLAGSGLGGLIIKSAHPDVNPILEELAESGYPAVSLFPQRIEHLKHNWIDTDNLRAGRLAAEHLLAGGYERYHWITSSESEANVSRFRGFLEALEGAGVADRFAGTLRFEGDYNRLMVDIRELLAGSVPCGVATADASAHHVAIAAQQIGLRFPEDIGIVGHDCHLWHALFPVPTITNITVSQEEAGRLAVDMACDITDGKERRADPIVLEPILTQGETTAPPSGVPGKGMRSG